MQFPILPNDTDTTPLDDVLSRLSGQEAVTGILLIGSTATGTLTPASDYDIVLVFAELSRPARLITTWIAGRFAEVFCTTEAAVERIIAEPSRWPADTSEEERLLRWLRSGAIVFDRAGLLARAAATARATPASLPSELAIYQAWWGINYNVVQMRRYLSSPDARSHHAAALRFLYSLMDIVSHYFTVRQIPWEGEKAAIQYWTEFDPSFWDLLRQALDEPDLDHKREFYEELARRTLEPVGGLWPTDSTSVWLAWGWGTGQEPVEGSVIDQAAATLSCWHDLVGS